MKADDNNWMPPGSQEAVGLGCTCRLTEFTDDDRVLVNVADHTGCPVHDVDLRMRAMTEEDRQEMFAIGEGPYSHVMRTNALRIKFIHRHQTRIGRWQCEHHGLVMLLAFALGALAPIVVRLFG